MLEQMSLIKILKAYQMKKELNKYLAMIKMFDQ